jgi:hypothetical protein
MNHTCKFDCKICEGGPRRDSRMSFGGTPSRFGPKHFSLARVPIRPVPTYQRSTASVRMVANGRYVESQHRKAPMTGSNRRQYFTESELGKLISNQNSRDFATATA